MDIPPTRQIQTAILPINTPMPKEEYEKLISKFETLVTEWVNGSRDKGGGFKAIKKTVKHLPLHYSLTREQRMRILKALQTYYKVMQKTPKVTGNVFCSVQREPVRVDLREPVKVDLKLLALQSASMARLITTASADYCLGFFCSPTLFHHFYTFCVTGQIDPQRPVELRQLSNFARSVGCVGLATACDLKFASPTFATHQTISSNPLNFLPTLPSEVMNTIFSFLSLRDCWQFSQCSQWAYIRFTTAHHWQQVIETKWPFTKYYFDKAQALTPEKELAINWLTICQDCFTAPKTWDIAATCPCGETVTACLPLPSGRIAIGLKDGTICLWNPALNTRTFIIKEFNEPIQKFYYLSSVEQLIAIDTHHVHIISINKITAPLFHSFDSPITASSEKDQKMTVACASGELFTLDFTLFPIIPRLVATSTLPITYLGSIGADTVCVAANHFTLLPSGQRWSLRSNYPGNHSITFSCCFSLSQEKLYSVWNYSWEENGEWHKRSLLYELIKDPSNSPVMHFIHAKVTQAPHGKVFLLDSTQYSKRRLLVHDGHVTAIHVMPEENQNVVFTGNDQGCCCKWSFTANGIKRIDRLKEPNGLSITAIRQLKDGRFCCVGQKPNKTTKISIRNSYQEKSWEIIQGETEWDEQMKEPPLLETEEGDLILVDGLEVKKILASTLPGLITSADDDVEDQ